MSSRSKSNGSYDYGEEDLKRIERMMEKKLELIEFERRRRLIACEELTSSVLLNHLKKKRVTNELRIEDAVVSSAVGDEGSASKKRKLLVHQDSQHY